nr:hypothetical protein [Magnetospirillum moscoviense]
MKKASALPAHIETVMEALHHDLTPEQMADPCFAYRVIFVPKSAARASAADVAVEFVKPGSDEASEINRVLLKEVDKQRYTTGQIVKMMNSDGFPRFKQHHHTQLWKALNARDHNTGFGRPGDYRGTWVWYDSWLARVRAHCQEQKDRYVALT